MIRNFLKQNKKPILWTLLTVFVLISVLGAVAYSKRDAILQKMLQKALIKAKDQYHLDVKVNNVHFSGIRTLVANDVSIVPEQRDSLFSVEKFSVSVEILPLIFGNVKLYHISLENGKLFASFKKDQSNLDFLLKREKNKDADTTKKRDLASLSYRIMKQILNKIPSEMDINNFRMELNDHDSSGFKLLVKDMNVNSGDLEGNLQIDSATQDVAMEGTFNANDDEVSMKLIAPKGDSIRLNYLEQKLHLKFNCGSLGIALTNFTSKNNETQIYTQFSTTHFKFYHPKIASKYIEIPTATFDANIFIGDQYIALDSSSKITVKDAFAHPFAKYTPGKNKIYEVGVHIPKQEAQNIIDAFPKGTFESFEGMETTGEIEYRMGMYLDTKTPDDVKFTSNLIPYDFKIKKFGKVDFSAINQPFKHDIYEDEQYVRTIEVGPNNPNFTPFAMISPQLIQCVLTSEDPSFFTNNGFVLESIRKSIAENYKKHKFVRGGSTISMQLVKNAFLNREKTLIRKIEEMAIVWLIHDQKLVSKQRMLEVYFNIIELGKNIYGIGESTHYYFNFEPKDITLGHGLFYSNIIPSPKKTLQKFMSNGQLKPYIFPYFKFIGNIMAKKGLIPYDGNGYGFYNVLVQPSLRSQLDAPNVVSPTDTLSAPEMDWFEEFKLQNPDAEMIPPPVVRKITKEDSVRNVQSRLMDSIDHAQTPLSPKEERKLKRAQKRAKKP